MLKGQITLILKSCFTRYIDLTLVYICALCASFLLPTVLTLYVYCCTCGLPVCADRRPPGPGSCLPHGGRGGRLQCATNSPHTWHRLPLLLLQLPLRPQPAAAKTQTGLCSCHESQSCCSTYEGVYFFFLTKEFILKKKNYIAQCSLLCQTCASDSSKLLSTPVYLKSKLPVNA